MEMYNCGDHAGSVHAFFAAVFGPDWRSYVESTVPGGVEQAEKDAAMLFESDLPSVGAWEFGAEQAVKINQPVLYVLGAESLPSAGEGRDLLHSWLLQTEDAVLAGATHALQMARPADAATALADFLKRHPAAA